MNMKNNIHPIPGSPSPASLQGGKGETIPAPHNGRGLMARLKGASCLFALLSLSLSLVSCIDEDLSRCGVNYSVDYVVHQQTDLQAEVAAVLSSPQEQEAAEAVETALGGVFTDLAHDLDLSFYANHDLAYHERNIIDASSASFTFYLQQADYRHLTLANVTDEPVVTLEGTNSDLSLSVSSMAGDTLPTHSRPLFSSRLDMPLEGREASFRSDLYMLNSAVAVVLAEPAGKQAAVSGCVSGMASSFAVNDSVYAYSPQAVTRMEQTRPQGYRVLYATTLPSPDNAPGNPDDGIWQVKVYVTIDGKITENVLHVGEPLSAGKVKVIKGVIKDDGSVSTESPEVGVSVTLDWKPGGDHDVEM